MYRNDTNAASRPNPSPRPALHAARYRARDFGTGYGASSGYASNRRYVMGSQPLPRFRLA